MARVLAILVDALRYDLVNDKDTPFIHSLAKHGFKLPLRPILGYSDAIRATIFTGTYPDRHGYWMSYSYSPDTSPFKTLKCLSFIDYIPNDLMRRGLKFLLSSTVMKILSRLMGYHSLHLHNIPFRIIDKFDMTTRKDFTDPDVFPGYPTIFDVLRRHGIKFAYLDSSKLKRKLLREVRNLEEDTAFTFVYLHYIDEAAHWFGMRSSKFRRSLKIVDQIARMIVATAGEKFGDSLEIMVFSDHGMAEEQNTIDMDWMMRIDGFGRDFVFSLDATMVRAWYMREDKRGELRRLISATANCRLLSDREARELGVSFDQRSYGDDIFLFDEGQIIFPNFYSYVRPRAMHAYDPALPSQQGVFILLCKDRSIIRTEMVELIDIGPTVLALLDIPAPSTCQGKTLLL